MADLTAEDIKIIGDAFAQGEREKNKQDLRWTARYENVPGPNGSLLWYIRGEFVEDKGATYTFHHVQYSGTDYNTRPAGGTTTEPSPTTAPTQYGDAKQKKFDVINKARELQTAAGEHPMGPTHDVSGQVRPISLEDLSAKKLKALFSKAQAYIDGYNSDIKVIERARGFQKTAGETQLGQSYNGINLTPTPTSEINAKQANKLANQAQAYIDDYKTDLADIKAAKGMQKENEDKVLVKGKVNISNINAKRADKLGDTARTYITEHKTNSDTGAGGPGGGSQGPGGSSDSTKTQKNDGKKQQDKSGGDNGNKDNKPMPNAAKGNQKKDEKEKQNNVSFHRFDPNGDNLLARFAKVYGNAVTPSGKTVAQDELDKAIQAFRDSGGTIDETYKGQYGYAVSIESDGKTITDPDEIKNKLAVHAGVSTYFTQQYPDDPERALTLTQANLTNTTGGGTETGLTRRFALAYANGDTVKGKQILEDAVKAYMAANPKNIKIMGPNGQETQLGQPGAYIQVLSKGEYTSNSDIVSQTLAGSVTVDGAAAVPFDKQTAQQQAFLGGASGNNVMNRLNLALSEPGTAPSQTPESLRTALAKYKALHPGDITTYGTIGQPDFYIEINTAKGKISGTNAVVNRLHEATTAPATKPADIKISEAAQKSKALIGVDVKKDGTIKSKIDQQIYATADVSKNGTVSMKELVAFDKVANTNNKGGVSKVEAKAFNVLDNSSNGKLSKNEKAAFKQAIDKNGNGELSKKDIKNAAKTLQMKASIDASKATQKQLDAKAVAQGYLDKAGKKSGGQQVVIDQSTALITVQPAKRNNNNNEGPGNKKKKNK